MRTLITASLMAIASIGLVTTTLYAQDKQPAQVAQMGWLSIPEVYTRLESAGYRNIEKIERERGSYEVKATDRNGQRMKLYVHPQTGEIINQRGRETKRDKYDKNDNYGSDSSRGNRRNSADCNERRCRDDLPQPGVPAAASAPRPAPTK